MYTAILKELLWVIIMSSLKILALGLVLSFAIVGTQALKTSAVDGGVSMVEPK